MAVSGLQGKDKSRVQGHVQGLEKYELSYRDYSKISLGGHVAIVLVESDGWVSATLQI